MLLRPAGSLILYPMALIMDILWCIEHNLSTHKKAFVLLAKDKPRGKIDSVFIDFIGYIFILMLCYSQIKLAFS